MDHSVDISSVNEIFDPSRVDTLYTLPADIRRESIAQDRATNYGVVRLELIERLYNSLYHQRLRCDNASSWPHNIVTLRDVVGMEENRLGQVYLKLRNTRTGETEMTTGFDAVIIATGYVRNVHETLLKPAKSLIKGDSCTVGRDYKVKFREGTVAEDSGVWLQGCCESSHGVSALASLIANFRD